MYLIASSGLVFDVLKLALYIAFAYLALSACARHAQSHWHKAWASGRLAVLALMTLLAVGVKVFEDVVAKESGPVDTALLGLIRQNTPTQLVGFFTLVTLSGAGKFLAPATAILASLLFVAQHRREALLLAASMLLAWALTYILKALVDRARPDLWSTAWYWGASFPSGHTLSAAAFATALGLGASRCGPSRVTPPRHWPLCGFFWSGCRVWCWVCIGQQTCWQLSAWVCSYRWLSRWL